MHSTKPSVRRVLSAVGDLSWSDATAAGAVIHRERLLALGARLPGRAGALFRDPGGPQAVEAWWTACDAVDMQPVPPGDGSGIEEWDAESERRATVHAEAGKHISPIRRVMDW